MFDIGEARQPLRFDFSAACFVPRFRLFPLSRMTRPMKPLRYDYRGVLIDETGIAQSDLDSLAPRLEACRREVLEEVK